MERIAEKWALLTSGRWVLRAPGCLAIFGHPFMPKSEKFEAYRGEYERDAAEGRAWAASARRASDGSFIS